MKKWMWWIVGAIGVYIAYTMFFKPKTASDEVAAAGAKMARARR